MPRLQTVGVFLWLKPLPVRAWVGKFARSVNLFSVMHAFFAFLMVFIGGGLGSMCRYGVWLLLRPWQVKFPWATLLANGLACIVLGILLGWQAQAVLSDQRRLLLVTGFCGGFSTYSTFTAETWGLWENGQPALALSNVFINLFVCVICLLIGFKLGH